MMRETFVRVMWRTAPILAVALQALCCAQSSEVPFGHVVIDEVGPKDPWIKALADVSGDGLADVIVGGQAGPLVWYSYPSWQKSVIAAGGYDAVDGEAADVDGDGDLDIVMGGVIWYENPRPKEDPAKEIWKAHRIGSHNSHDVEVTDLDGDGDVDVVTRGQSGFGSKAGNKIFLWRQDSLDSWSPRVIECPHGEGLALGDMDGDGDGDVVIGARWYENPKDIVGGSWAEHVYSSSWTHEDTKVEVGDINGDGRPDVALTPAEGNYRIAWFESPKDPRKGAWTEHVVETSIGGIHSLQIADMDGDGNLDVVVAKMHQYEPPHDVAIYFNERKGEGWKKDVLATKGSHNVQVGDIGNDGDLDVMGANWSGPYQPVELWENRRSQGETRPRE